MVNLDSFDWLFVNIVFKFRRREALFAYMPFSSEYSLLPQHIYYSGKDLMFMIVDKLKSWAYADIYKTLNNQYVDEIYGLVCYIFC